MKFCTNCGKQLNDDAKFCDTCGAPVSGTQTPPPIPGANENVGDDTKRKVTYVGVEKRCPWCNARIPDSFAITCPECHRELSGRRVESSVKDFFTRLSDLSGGYESSDDRDKKEYFGIGKIFLFVLAAGMFLFSTTPEELHMDSGSPLVIGGFILIIIGVIIRPPLSQEEKKRRNLIETFVVPNTKESIIEFLMLACSQIQPGSNMFTKEGKKTALWNKVWKTKIRQTLTKSKLLFMNDKNAQEQITLIKKEYKIR